MQEKCQQDPFSDTPYACSRLNINKSSWIGLREKLQEKTPCYIVVFHGFPMVKSSCSIFISWSARSWFGQVTTTTVFTLPHPRIRCDPRWSRSVSWEMRSEPRRMHFFDSGTDLKWTSQLNSPWIVPWILLVFSCKCSLPILADYDMHSIEKKG